MLQWFTGNIDMNKGYWNVLDSDDNPSLPKIEIHFSIFKDQYQLPIRYCEIGSSERVIFYFIGLV